MDDSSQESTPPWLSEDLPKGDWHADVDFLERAYDDLEILAKILDPDPLWNDLTPVVEEQCDCNSVDGGDHTDSEEMEETYCPRRSASQPDFHRTFLVLERVIPRLKFAAQKLDGVINKFTKRAQESRERWQRRTQAEVNQYSQTTCHLERMPLEVISSIASMASQKDRRIPFTLSRVNSTLRRLVLSMPLIWTNLDAADPIANTKLRIRRSQLARLTLNMWIHPHLTEEEGKVKLSRFIKILEPERHRVQKLIIEPFFKMWMLQSVQFLQQGGFECLETLHIGCVEEDPKNRRLKGTILPAQRELSIKNVFVDCVGSSPHANIARLSLVEVTLPLIRLQSTFLAMPALEILVLDEIRLEERGDSFGEAVVLPQLRYLVMKKSNAGLISSMIETPGLFSFQLDNPVANRPSDSDPDGAEMAILPAIAKRNGQLRRLHVVGCFMTAEAWTESFYNLPELEYLRIKGCHIEANHLAGLRGLETETAGIENGHRLQLSACQRLVELVFENEFSIDSGTIPAASSGSRFAVAMRT
ncbi:hypothetical protein M407DRAFT_31212 [Tulasnella calospora MUT 4182]|uniref:F-box domain-containing protein n=1 Tax=Tulasnella calospora MUT 4182 TaxID=1051891 RepID=A0A0C3Q612_9AGAM|nr:hypothetical protein M407DRAFT_31212 [Tulasnella calospora MUT 4182]